MKAKLMANKPLKCQERELKVLNKGKLLTVVLNQCTQLLHIVACYNARLYNNNYVNMNMAIEVGDQISPAVDQFFVIFQ